MQTSNSGTSASESGAKEAKEIDMPSRAVGQVHTRFVFARRIRRLAHFFSELIPKNARVLDVGCGDGAASYALLALRPDLSVEGIDVVPRERPLISVEMYDGQRIPRPDNSCDVVLLSDVLHHTENPASVLREVSRVTSRYVLIKDHYRQGWAAQRRLRFMDWVGNARFGVALTYNYLNPEEWAAAWKEAGLRPDETITKLHLYPVPLDWIFGARLHFVARLTKSRS